MELILKDGTRKPVCGDCHRAVAGMRRGRSAACCAARRARIEADRAKVWAMVNQARTQLEERIAAGY